MKRRIKMDRILTVEQMTFCEHESEKYGVSLAQLMENAAAQLAAVIEENACKTSKIVLLIGKGNNGGDGLVAANILLSHGFKPVMVLCCGEPDTDLSSAAFAKLDKGVQVLTGENALSNIEGADVLVDCIFGTGFHGSLRENILPVFKACEKCSGMKIACDLPSGVNARNGQADKLSFKAALTVTFHRGKLGLYLQPAVDFCGEILVKDIGINKRCEDTIFPVITPFDVTKARAALPARPSDGHKGTFGKVVSVCGSESYIGAAGLSAMAAMRTGVGLFELCSAKSVVQSLSGNMFECTYSAMKTDEDGFMVSENADKILEKCEKAKCLLVGCGLGHTAETEKLVAELIENAEIPIVLDADGINSLCPNIDVLLKKKNTVILTPHPAELARLCGVTVGEVMSDRLGFACKLAKKYDVTVLAKSADTFAVSGERVYLCTEGTTALAKGGSGDMLAGIVSSYCAQGCEAIDAAALGSYTLGSAAALAGYKHSERGVIARDIIDALPRFLYELESSD